MKRLWKLKNIPTKILKEFKTELSEPLSDMINVSFNKGVFPGFLKVANIILIHKKGEKLDPNNYRPISLLSNISSKLYKKAIQFWLTNFLRKNKVLFSYQFGFQNNYYTNHYYNNHSTNHVILIIVIIIIQLIMLS